MRKKIIIITIAILIVVGLGGYGLYTLKRTNDYQTAVANITIENIDFSTLKDGEYIGEYDVDFIFAKVKVVVKDKKVTSMEFLEYVYDRGGKAAVLIDHMVEQQKIDVDVISGATNSSRVIQKAVENALIDE